MVLRQSRLACPFFSSCWRPSHRSPQSRKLRQAQGVSAAAVAPGGFVVGHRPRPAVRELQHRRGHQRRRAFDGNLYIAPIGMAHLSKTAFYGGIQTQVDGYTKRDQHLRKIGPGFIFSMWGQRSLDAIRPSVGGFCESSGYEGDFVSVRRAYEWKKGKFTYKVVRMDKEEIDGKPSTWVGVFVYPHEKDENVFVGALRFKGENLVLSRKVASFVEVYGRRIPLTEIPKVTVTFGNLMVNGRPVKVVSATAIYPKKVPDYAEAVAKDGTVVVTVGHPVENRTQRQVRLIGK